MRDLTGPVERVAAMARSHPREPAIFDVREADTTVWTWSDLERASERIAALLARLRVSEGEVVAYQLANRAEFIAITLAILRCGAICCPLMPIFRERELEDLLGRARVRVLFLAAEYRGRRPTEEIAAVEPRLPHLEHVLVLGAGGAVGAQALADAQVAAGARGTAGGAMALPRSSRVSWSWLDGALAATATPAAGTARDGRSAAQGAAHDSRGAPGPARLAQLLFTSGTSGEPKGVLHRLDTLTRAVELEIEHLGLGPQDRIYIPSPLAHQTGFLYGMWLALVLGVPAIVQETWNPRQGLAALAAAGGTFVQAATPFLADLLDAVEAGEAPPRTLRIFVATGAAVPRTLARRATQLLGTAVCGAFGTTEGCLATLSSPADSPEKAWGADGRPLRSIELRIRDAEGRALGPGEEGHFETHSPTMLEGYLDHPDWTAAAYTPDGWYRTGDLALVDAEGFLHVTGRVKDVINRGGEKIPVAEIEQLLHQHDAVKEVAIVAMPDPRLGERACAFVVPRAGGRTLDFPSMQRFLDERRVAKPYWPERLEIVEALPRTPSGKIQKYRLRERARTLAATRGTERA